MTIRRAALWLLPAALAGAFIAAPPVTAQAPNAVSVPAATLTEIDVPGTSPMSATAVDLAAVGYTAREFYAAGFANRYTGADANTLTTASVLDGGNPYRTRVMVRYPSPDKFNGTLAVEWATDTGQCCMFAAPSFLCPRSHRSLRIYDSACARPGLNV